MNGSDENGNCIEKRDKKVRTVRTINIAEEMRKLAATMSNCMQKAIEEDPESAKTWTPEELFKKGSEWAARNVLITEKENEMDQR